MRIRCPSDHFILHSSVPPELQLVGQPPLIETAQLDWED